MVKSPDDAESFTHMRHHRNIVKVFVKVIDACILMRAVKIFSPLRRKGYGTLVVLREHKLEEIRH